MASIQRLFKFIFSKEEEEDIIYLVTGDDKTQAKEDTVDVLEIS